MNKDQIFIGDIKKCIDVETKVDFGEYYTEYSCDCTLIPIYISETYKKNVYLYKTKDNKYIDLSELNSYLDFIKINRNKTRNNIIIDTQPDKIGALYVDENTLKPIPISKKECSFYNIKKLIKKNS